MRVGDGAGLRSTAPVQGEIAESLSARALCAWIDFAVEPVPDGAAPADEQDAEVNAVVAEFGGDMRAAIKALLHDLTVLAEDFGRSVSRGYVRGSSASGASRPLVRR